MAAEQSNPGEATTTETFALLPGVSGNAEFGPGNKYRYWLERRWSTALPQFTYVLLNPSVASEDRDDRTTRRLCSLTQTNGGGGYELVNLFAIVDTRQEHLHKSFAVGETASTCDKWIIQAVKGADTLVIGWGDGDARQPPVLARQRAIRQRGRDTWPIVRFAHPQCFGWNDSGSPKYPGRLSEETTIVDYFPKSGYL
jgi:hypothetical protein